MLAGAVTLLLVASTLPAQGGMGITWGPSVALNMSTWGGSDVTDAKSKMGFGLGVVVDKSTEGKPLFWRSGASFSMEGVKFEDPSFGKSTVKLNYIRVPVMAGWKLNMANPKTVPYVGGGVSLGLNAGCSVEDEPLTGASSSDDCDAVGAKVKAIDLGLLIAGGVAMAAGSGTIDISAQYGMGLSSIDDSGAGGDVKNRGFGIVVVYKLPAKKK